MWLPAYAWWPHPDEYDASVILTPYHAAVEPEALFSFTVRGYDGSNQPLWEYFVEDVYIGRDFSVRLSDLGVPPPPPGQGAILEVHGVRHDRMPKKGTGFIGMWVDAQAPQGGGYVIPTIPIRAQAKAIQRDDVQVVPGIVATKDVDTELVLLNVVDAPTQVKLVASSIGGLIAESDPITIAPWTAWRGSLKHEIPRLRSLLREGDGVGSLSIQSSHKILPYFGFRKADGPLLSLDHTAPIFA